MRAIDRNQGGGREGISPTNCIRAQRYLSGTRHRTAAQKRDRGALAFYEAYGQAGSYACTRTTS